MNKYPNMWKTYSQNVDKCCKKLIYREISNYKMLNYVKKVWITSLVTCKTNLSFHYSKSNIYQKSLMSFVENNPGGSLGACPLIQWQHSLYNPIANSSKKVASVWRTRPASDSRSPRSQGSYKRPLSHHQMADRRSSRKSSPRALAPSGWW